MIFLSATVLDLPFNWSLSVTGLLTELPSSTVDESHSIGLSISVTGPPTARGGAAVGERVRIGDVGLDADYYKVLDIAHGVHNQFTKPPEDIGAGDQGHLFVYANATDETIELMPLSHALAVLDFYSPVFVMASVSPFFDDLRTKPEVIDPPQNEDMLDVGETLNDQTNIKSNLIASSSVRELLECPVCLNAMYPPIHQCSNGHTICSGCKPRVHNRCPTCRHELGNIRCLALEKVAASLEIPCKYQSFGCIGIYPYYSKLKHESQCVYRPYTCPYAGSECTVIGDIPYLVAHLKDDHKVDMHSGSTFNHRYVKSNPHEVENATWMLTVFSCFGQYFCLHFEAFQLGMAPVYIAFLRFMGDDNEAKNYSYTLEVGGNGRKMIYQGVPRSVRDSHRKVRDSFDGLIIQRNMALFFSGGDRKELKLRVTGRIWKEQ
ncbi:hypothetical protein ACFE04_002178 [Oxalis oulophora]